MAIFVLILRCERTSIKSVEDDLSPELKANAKAELKANAKAELKANAKAEERPL